MTEEQIKQILERCSQAASEPLNYTFTSNKDEEISITFTGRSLVERIVTLMGKDTAVEPIPSWDGQDPYECPACGGFVLYGDYCDECGQKLKWGDYQ